MEQHLDILSEFEALQGTGLDLTLVEVEEFDFGQVEGGAGGVVVDVQSVFPRIVYFGIAYTGSGTSPSLSDQSELNDSCVP